MEHFMRKKAKPKNKEEHFGVIQAFWVTVTLEKCCCYINHLKKVISKVIEVNGEATGY